MKQMNKKGFTLIELTLSIAFIGALLLGIASIILGLSSIYQKGLSLRAVNASGQQIIEDINKAVNSASYVADIARIDENHDGFISDEESKKALDGYFYEAVNVNDQTQNYGAFCIANYTYVWNTARSLQNGTGVTINGVRYRLARFPDPNHKQCNKELEGEVTVANSNGVESVDIAPTMATEPVELITKDEVDLALYDFSVIPATQSVTTKQAFINISFILATLKGGVNIKANGDYCQGSDVSEFNDYDFDYCAVNKFNFSVRTGGNARKKG
jgi:type II secretory pathway pseudopilin PulG